MVVRQPDDRCLTRFLDELTADQGPVLWIDGDAGSGKTTLIDRFIERAGAANIQMMRAIGTPAERDIAFAGLHALVWPVRDHLERLPACQRDALASAIGLGPAEGVDRLRIAAATLALIEEVSGAGPLAVVVDDLQWLDPATSSLVDFLAARLEGGSAGILAARRTGERTPSPQGRIRRHRLAPLAAEEVNQLLADHGIQPVDPTVARELSRRLSGNPLAVIEAARTLAPAQRSGGHPLPESLPVGDGIQARYARGFEQLPVDLRTTLVTLALMQSRDCAVADRALTVLGIEASRQWNGAFADMVRVDGTRVEFTHPLRREAIIAASDAAMRRRVHAALAEAAPKDDIVGRALHLLGAADGPDPSVAEALDAACDVAIRRGDAAAAGRYARWAASVTEDRARRVARSVRAAQLAVRAGSAPDDDLAEAAAVAVDGDERAQIAMIGMFDALTSGDHARFQRYLVAARPVMADLAPSAAAEICAMELAEAWTRMDSGAIQTAFAELSGLVATAARTGLDLGPNPLAMHASFSAVHFGDSTALDVVVDAVGQAPETAVPVCVALVLLGRDETARQVCDTALASARAQRASGTIARITGFAALNAARRGEILRAQVLVAEFDETMASDPAPVNAVYAEAARAWIAFLRAEFAEAEEALAAARVAAPNPDGGLGLAAVWLVQGWLALATGRPTEATGHLERLHDRLRDAPVDSVVLWPFHTALAEAYQRLGRPEEGRDLLGELERITPGMPGWYPDHLLHRLRGMADGDPEAFKAALGCGHALDTVERVTTMLLLSDRLRRMRDPDAVMFAEQALAMAHEAQLEVLARWARRLLSLVGRHPGPREPAAATRLSPQEVRVARAVVQGRSNREVAAEMFLSVKTVEMHLSRIYRKIGARSRTDLVRMCGEGGIILD